MITLSILGELNGIAGAAGGALTGADTVNPFVFRLSIFVLAVGVVLVDNDAGPIWARALGFVALTFASVNIFGGFLVTKRMLAMFQRKQK